MTAYFQKKIKCFPRKFTLITAVIILGLLLPAVVQAFGFGDIANSLINGILTLALRVLSGLFGMIVAAFIAIVQFDFSNFWGVGESVDTAWRLLRDLSNMFFVVALLVIAFARILKIEQYGAARRLFQLLALAIAVNFSKTISLLILDAGQMLMMTFVRAFQDIAVDNLTSGLMISKIYGMGAQGGGWDLAGNLLTTWATQVLMIFMMVITVLVMLVIVILLIFRIGMIWFLVAVSPIAYIGHAFPGLKKHASSWWNFYLKIVFFGPFLAFFLWFAFLFMSHGLIPEDNFKQIEQNVGTAGFTSDPYFASDATSPGNIVKFLLAVILLIIGTGMAIKAADFGGNVAGKVWGGSAGGLGKGAKGWFDRWRAKGGKVRDLPGAKWLSKQPGIRHLGARIQGLRERIGEVPEGKEPGFFRTLISKGRAGIIAGEYKGPEALKAVIGRLAALHPIEMGFKLASPGGAAARKRAKELRDRQAFERAELETSAFATYLAEPGKGIGAGRAYLTDEKGRISKDVKRSGILQQILADENQLEEIGRRELEKEVDEKFDNERLGQIAEANKEMAEYRLKEGDVDFSREFYDDDDDDVKTVRRLLKKGMGDEFTEMDDEEKNEKIKEFIARHNKGYKNIQQVEQQRKDAKTDIKSKSPEELRRKGESWVNSQLQYVESSKKDLLGAKSADDGTDSNDLNNKGVEERLDKLNKMMEKEVDLLNRIRNTPDGTEKDGLITQLETLRKTQKVTELMSKEAGVKFRALEGAETNQQAQMALKELQRQIRKDYTQAQKSAQEKEDESEVLKGILKAADPEERKRIKAEKKKLDQEIGRRQANFLSNTIKAEFARKTSEVRLIEEEKKYLRTLDYPQLITYYQQAEADRNVNLAKAVMERLIEDGNINELTKIKDFGESPEAFHKLGDDFMEKFGLTQQDAYGFMKEISEASEKIGHWIYAYLYKIENGVYKKTTRREQAELSLPMMEKKQISVMVNNTRLALGGYKNGKPDITDHGLAWLMSHIKDPAMPWAVNRGIMRPEQLRFIFELSQMDNAVGRELTRELKKISVKGITSYPEIEKTFYDMLENRSRITVANIEQVIDDASALQWGNGIA